MNGKIELKPLKLNQSEKNFCFLFLYRHPDLQSALLDR